MRILFIILVLCCSTVLAQTHTGGNTVKLSRQPNDTTITPDPEDGKTEHVVVRNEKDIVVSRGDYVNRNKSGIWRDYTDLGVLTKLAVYKNGLLDGAFLLFNRAGQVMEDANYAKDSLDGLRLTMNNGRVKSMENYSKGVLHGERKTYYDDGKLQEESNYNMGQRDGVTTWYLQTGKPSLQYTYINGVIDGPVKEFNEDGSVKREGLYKNNAEDGEWKVYQDSSLVKKIIYKDGTIVKEVPVRK